MVAPSTDLPRRIGNSYTASMCATLVMRLICFIIEQLRRFVAFARVFAVDPCTQPSAIV